MKKLYIPVIALFAIAISCTVKENPVETVIPQEEGLTFQINGSIRDLVDSETKTTVIEDGSIFHSYWANGNTIRVDFDGVSNSPTTGTYSTSNGNFTCSKSGLTVGAHTLYAAYPYATGNVDDNTYTYTIPTTQTIPAINAICEAADHLVATPKEIVVDESGSISTVDMVFNRHSAILKIIPVDNTTGNILAGLKIKKITISYPQKLNTKIKVNKDGTTVNKIDTGASSFVINYDGNDFEFNDDVTGTDGAYLVVAPGQFTHNKAITFSVETVDGHYNISKAIASLASDITFARNELRPITVSFGDADVAEVAPAIVPVAPSKLAYDATSGTFNFTITNPDGISSPSASVTSGGSWLALAEPAITESAGVYTVHFTCSANDAPAAVERTGEITVIYTGATNQPVSITQREKGAVITTYTWGFTSSNASDTPTSSYTWNSNTAGQTISYAGQSGDGNIKYPKNSGTYVLKMNGTSNSGGRRYFTYAAPDAGTLKISGYKQGDNTNSLTVMLGSATVSPKTGSSSSFSSTSEATECEYNITAAGTVKFYTDNKAYFKSVVFTY